MGKLYDLAVVTGSYTNSSGEEKKRWKNIGSVIETKDGGKVILIDRTFNPAGVPVEPGRESIMVSMFKPNDDNNGQQNSAPPPSQHQQAKSNGYAAMDDEIPF